MPAEAREAALSRLTVAQLQALYATVVNSRPDEVILDPCCRLQRLVGAVISSGALDFASAVQCLRKACSLAAALVVKQSLTLPSFVRAVEDHLHGLEFESIQGRMCAVLHPAGRGVEVLGYQGTQGDPLRVGDLILAVEGVSLVNFPFQVCRLFLRGTIGTCKKITLLRDGDANQLEVSLEDGDANNFKSRLQDAKTAADTLKLVSAARVQLEKEIASALRQAYGSREHRRRCEIIAGK